MAVCSERLDFISICTGGGGLDLGVELAVPGSRAVCMVEREAFGAARLVSAMEDGLLAPAPVWSDARTFSGRRWRGCVDGLIGGIPCQPHSVAGKRHGSADERDLWSTARRIVVQSGAWVVLIENVPGMLSSSDPELRSGGERVWRDLQRLGFAVEGGLFSAAEVGAPHERERVFILGVADASRSGHQRRELGRASGEVVGLSAPGSASELRGACLVDAAGQRRREGRAQSELWSGRSTASFTGGALGHAHGVREQQPHDQDGAQPRKDARDRAGGAGLRPVGAMGDAGRGGRAGRSQGALGQSIDGTAAERPGAGPLWPPRPNDLDGWRGLLAARPEVEPAVRGDAHGVASRVDELRMLGNGVVPLEAAHALRTLAVRLSARSAAAARLVRMMNAPERQDERSAA